MVKVMQIAAQLNVQNRTWEKMHDIKMELLLKSPSLINIFLKNEYMKIFQLLFIEMEPKSYLKKEGGIEIRKSYQYLLA